MDIKIPVSTLQEVVNKLSVVVKMNTDDVTSMMLIDATGEDVKFSATNVSTNMTMTIDDCTVDKKGKVLLRLVDIKRYVNKFTQLSGGYGTDNFRVLIDKNAGQLKTKTLFESGSPAYRTLKFAVYNTGLFPNIKGFGEASLIINSNILKEGLEKVMGCVNPGEIRIAMSGVYIMIDKDKMTFVGTNGIKLSESILTINGDIDGKDFILKHDIAAVLRAVLPLNSQVFMYFEDRYVYVSCNNIYVNGTLIINETYPNYKSAITTYDKTLSVPKYDIADSVSAAAEVLDPEDNNRLTVEFRGNTFNLKNDRVDIVHELDDEFEYELDVDVNGFYFLSLLNDMSGEYLDVCFKEDNNTVIFKPRNEDGHTSLITTVRRR